jgi:hypothetical protein
MRVGVSCRVVIETPSDVGFGEVHRHDVPLAVTVTLSLVHT